MVEDDNLLAVSPVVRALRQAHAQELSEQADQHALALESILAILRSTRLSDVAARSSAIDVAANDLVRLRTANDERQSNLLEPVTRAFARLQSDLRPLVRFGGLDLQFVEPPPAGRAVPGVIAHAARAMVRAVVLALADDGEAQRVRVQWDCDGRNLLVSIRDDGQGTLSARDDKLRPVLERVVHLDGDLSVESTQGWGSVITASLPLDPPANEPLPDIVELSPREKDVLRLVTAGASNREISQTLAISENTAKFHVSNLLRKTATRSRSELASLMR